MNTNLDVNLLPNNLCVVWLRSDLRIQDNPALFYASQYAKESQAFLVCTYIITPKQWKAHSESPAKLGFIRNRLKILQEELAAFGIPLIIQKSDDFDTLPNTFLKTFSKKNILGVWVNHQYGLNEQRVDKKLSDGLSKKFNCTIRSYHGDLIFPPGEILNQQKSLYQVFTPFLKTWHKNLAIKEIDSIPLPFPQTFVKWDFNAFIPEFGGHYREDLWPVDSTQIHKRLNVFLENAFLNYDEKRDIPSTRGTSVISTYLATGAIGIRECLSAVRQRYPDDVWRQHQWITELVWREFYRHWLATAPKLSKGYCFKSAGDKVKWRTGDAADLLFNAWSQGNTGFPIVDAGMRQLKQTGWMHNRLRMITASFLSKLLLIDWRRGEQFFMAYLMDGDFASNNGGWQWAASVGADAAPYFRIFNPYRQSERFDKSGVYIHRFIPELREVNGKSIHKPTTEECLRYNYPTPIIDYTLARKAAMQAFDVAYKS